MKKIITLLLAALLSLQSVPAFAYDEDKVQSYVKSLDATKYNSVQEIDDDYEEIMRGLLQNEDCDEETATAVFEEFKSMKQNFFDSEKSDDKNQEDNTQPEPIQKDVSETDGYKLLKQLGILNDIELSGEKNIKRDEFCTLVAKMVNYGEDYSDAKGYFEFADVTEENANYAAIASLINKGAIIGVGGGIFEPTADITVDEACVILLKLMGYEALEGALNQKELECEHDLMKHIGKKTADVMTGREAAELLYNAMFAKVVNKEIRGNDKIYYYADNTLLSEYMNIDYTDDIVYADANTSIYSSDGAVSDNALKIGERTYYFYDENRYIDGYLGKTVRVFYDIDTYDGKAVLDLERKNEITTVQARDIDTFDETSSSLYYEEKGRRKYQTVTMDTKIVFNGVAVDYEHDKKDLLCPDVGEVTFIDNNTDGKTDVIMVSSYVYYWADDVSAAIPVLYDITDVQPKLDLNDEKIKIYHNGETASADLIVKNKLVMALPSRIDFVTDITTGIKYAKTDVTNSKVIKLEIVDDTVSGNVLSVNLDEKEIKLGENTYSLSQNLIKHSEINTNKYFKMPSTGNNVAGYCDKYGEVAFILITGYTADLKYAYVKKIYTDEDTEDVIARLFNQHGEHIDLTFAQKVNVHKKWEDSVPLTIDSYYAKTVKSHEIAQGGYDRQLVKYALNDEGKIKEWYIADTSLSKDTFGTMDFYVGDDVFMMSYKSDNAKNFSYWYTTPDPGVYFTIPTGNNAGNDSYYVAEKLSGNLIGKNVELYDVSEGGYIGCVVMYESEFVQTGKRSDFVNTPVIVSKAPIAKYDEKTEEITYEIEVLQIQVKGKNWVIAPKTYKFSDDRLMSYTTNETTFYPSHQTKIKEGYSNIPIKDLKKGDYIAISVDTTTDKIDGFFMVSRNPGEILETGKPEYGCWYISPVPTNTTFSRTTESMGSSTLSKGNVERRSEKYIYVNCGEVEGVQGFVARRQFYNRLTNSVVLYNKSDKSLEIVKPSEIREGDYVISYYPMDALTLVVRNWR